MVINDINMERASNDSKSKGRLDKIELNGEKALDEIYGYKE